MSEGSCFPVPVSPSGTYLQIPDLAGGDSSRIRDDESLGTYL